MNIPLVVVNDEIIVPLKSDNGVAVADLSEVNLYINI